MEHASPSACSSSAEADHDPLVVTRRCSLEFAEGLVASPYTRAARIPMASRSSWTLMGERV